MILQKRSVGKALVAIGVICFITIFLYGVWAIHPALAILLFSGVLIALGQLIMDDEI